MIKFTVKEWMNELVVFVEPGNTVSEALSRMRRRYINSLIVKTNGDHSVYGILTSKDVSDKIVAMDKNPSVVLVKEIMTTPLITIDQNSSLKECALLMSEKHIHHLPVVDDKKKIVGMISATDFLVAAEALGKAPGDRII
ncbi:MAG: CBS domain-containing protein [Anaerolineaceae bacterium]|nr:CBS domain-containing protein [Anaerolineaceae bacterium]